MALSKGTIHRGSRIWYSSKSWFIFSCFKYICYLTPQPSLFGFNSGEHLSKCLSLNWMRPGGGLRTHLFIFINQRFFPETVIILLSSSSVLWPIHKKALGAMEVWSRRLINSTFAGQGILGACCRIINTAKWPQSRETKGEKDLGAEHDFSIKSLEKLILTALITVIDCQFLGSEWCWLHSILWSPLPLLLLNSGLPVSVTCLTSHYTPWKFSSVWI